MTKKSLLLPFLLATSFVSIQANEVENIKNVSKELVKVRQEIEELHSTLSFKKSEFNDQMRSYSNQKSDLDIKISRNELKIKELERDLLKIKEENKEKSSTQKDIVPVLKDAIANLRVVIKDSIPFKKVDRLSALNEIKNRLDANLVTPNKVANQLWAFVEDEMMLGKTSGLYNDTVEIDGTKKLVKVLKIGKIAIFYKDGESYGMIKKRDGAWVNEKITSKDDVVNTAKLFDTFSKQIRTGKFTIKNIIPQS
jgi:aspartyl-tRNA synthetase